MNFSIAIATIILSSARSSGATPAPAPAPTTIMYGERVHLKNNLGDNNIDRWLTGGHGKGYGVHADDMMSSLATMKGLRCNTHTNRSLEAKKLRRYYDWTVPKARRKGIFLQADYVDNMWLTGGRGENGVAACTHHKYALWWL